MMPHAISILYLCHHFLHGYSLGTESLPRVSFCDSFSFIMPVLYVWVLSIFVFPAVSLVISLYSLNSSHFLDKCFSLFSVFESTVLFYNSSTDYYILIFCCYMFSFHAFYMDAPSYMLLQNINDALILKS